MYVNRFKAQGPLGSAQSLGSAADIAEFLMPEQCQVEELEFTLSTATVSTGNIVVTFYSRPVKGSATGQVSIGTLSIVTALAAGKTVYKKVTPVTIPQGQILAVAVTTASAGGGAAGAGYSGAKISLNPEIETNMANMVASA